MNTLLIVISSNTNSDLKCSSPLARPRVYPHSWDDLLEAPHAFYLFAALLDFSLHGSRKGNMKKSCPCNNLFSQKDMARGAYGIISTICLFITGFSPAFRLAKSPVVKNWNGSGSKTSSFSKSHCGIYSHQPEDPRLTVMGSSKGEIVLGVMQGMGQSLGKMLAKCYHRPLQAALNNPHL